MIQQQKKQERVAKLYTFSFNLKLKEILSHYSLGIGRKKTVTDILNEAIREWVLRNKRDIKKEVNDNIKKILEELK